MPQAHGAPAIRDDTTDPGPTQGCQLVSQRPPASRSRSDDHAIAWVDDRLVLVIAPNTIVLVARAAQQLHYLPAPRRPTMQPARFNLISHPRRAGYSRISHVLTSEVVESFLSNSFSACSATVRSADPLGDIY
jgi:hypothetical protein